MAQNGVESDGGDISKGQQPTVAALPPPSGGVGSAPNSGNMPLNLNNKAAVQQQLQKMKDANSKYKNLLKMAKERIEKQEQELRTLRGMSLCVCLCVPYAYTPVVETATHRHVLVDIFIDYTRYFVLNFN